MRRYAVLLSVGFLAARSLAESPDPIPIERVEPDYPVKALEDCVEGYVVVELTIQPDGSVGDPRILEAKPAGYFEAAAVDAVSRWRYKRRVVDGKFVAMKGVPARVEFNLDRSARCEKADA